MRKRVLTRILDRCRYVLVAGLGSEWRVVGFYLAALLFVG
jgi:hypothetical protein